MCIFLSRVYILCGCEIVGNFCGRIEVDGVAGYYLESLKLYNSYVGKK
jgi:hypothetical protein